MPIVDTMGWKEDTLLGERQHRNRNHPYRHSNLCSDRAARVETTPTGGRTP